MDIAVATVIETATMKTMNVRLNCVMKMSCGCYCGSLLKESMIL